jgi:outer membrane protein
MNKARFAGLALLVWVITTASAHAWGVEVAGGAWRHTPSGEIGYEATSPNDLLDIENELNYDSETRLHGRAKIDLPLFLPNIYLMAAPAEFEGTGFKAASFFFGDEEFTGGTSFYSKTTFNQYDVALYYGLPFVRTGTLNTLNIDLGLNVRILDLAVEMRQGSLFEQEDAVIPVPQLYLGVQLTPLDWLAFEAEGRGLTIGGDSMYSLIGRIRFNIVGPLFIAGGYRYDRIDVDEDDIKVDFTVKGPFAELGLKF